MSRRLSPVVKIERALQGIYRGNALAALREVAAKLMAEELADMLAAEYNDAIPPIELARRVIERAHAGDAAWVEPDRLTRLACTQINIRAERIAATADPEAIATLSADPPALDDALAAALAAAIRGATCA